MYRSKIIHIILFSLVAITTTGCGSPAGEQVEVSASIRSTFCISGTAASAVPFADGSGTLQDPFIICSAAQLFQVATNLSGNYKLMNDIDLTGLVTPHPQIGDTANPFTGSFDGNDYKILNYRSETPGSDVVGLFPKVSGDGDFDGINDGIIKNLTLVNPIVEGRDFVGALTGVNLNQSQLNGIQIIGGVITGTNYVGGIAGSNFGTIAQGQTDAIIMASASHVGGLAGIDRGKIAYSQCGGTITGDQFVGGCTGGSYTATSQIYGSHSTALLTATNGPLGGISGLLEGEVNRSSSSVTLQMTSSTQKVGGIVGWQTDTGKLISSDAEFNFTTTDSPAMLGGLVGDNEGLVFKSSFIGDLTTQGNQLGGLVGNQSRQGQMIETKAEGNFSGQDSVGGLVGENQGIVFSSYASGSVSGRSNVGGAIGHQSDPSSLVSNSYSTLNSSATTTRAGGFVGWNEAGNIDRTYSTGIPNSPTLEGGLIGSSTNGSVTDSFFDRELAQTTISDGGTSATTSDMGKWWTFFNWDFTNLWTMPSFEGLPEGPPLLKWSLSEASLCNRRWQNVTINSDSHDGTIVSNTSIHSSGDPGYSNRNRSGYDSGKIVWSYLYFTLTENIPNTGKIQDARVKLYGDTSPSTNWNVTAHSLRFLGEKDVTTNSPTLNTDFPGGASGGTGTIAYSRWHKASGLYWHSTNQWNISPNLNKILQEIKDEEGGLNIGDVVKLWIRTDVHSTDDWVTFQDFQNSSGGSTTPTLWITWEECIQ